ncbi:MAG: methionine gamma-lyase family protein [Oscillospiraceae bacterium]
MQREFYKFDQQILSLSEKATALCADAFKKIDEICEYNEAKMLASFTQNKVSESHFCGSTGYGYGDRGREVLDAVFAQIVGAEDALVRHNFVSGTHALSVALFGVCRPNDKLLAVTGSPYDTMEEVIGIRGKGNGSLIDFGVKYEQVELLCDSKPDTEAIKAKCKDAKVVYIQRSRGYSLRESLTIEVIEEITTLVHKENPNAIVIVDNCYGEFVCKEEPCEVGADLIVGSLIKNAGGGIAKTGGYIAGRKDLVELASYRLTAVGMGKEVGCTLSQSREMFMGLFFAPSVVANAVKTSIFALQFFSLCGYEVFPKVNATRTDIIAAITLGNKEKLIAFCQGIQKGSPVDSFVFPQPWEMPGYESEVIMAAGAFTSGASIELSADAPLREPFAVWLQGGLTYNTGKIGVLQAAQNMLNQGILF